MPFQPVADFVLTLLQDKLPKNLSYHDIAHTLDVVKSAEMYCAMENVSKHDEMLIVTAAYFHDVGFIVKYEENEKEAARLAGEILPGLGFKQVEVEIIQKSILATILPQKAETLQGKILCDADLDYLGRNDYFDIADKLKKEWQLYGIIENSEIKWNEIQFNFLSAHQYFTTSAIGLRQAKKLNKLEQVKNILNALKQNV